MENKPKKKEEGKEKEKEKGDYTGTSYPASEDIYKKEKKLPFDEALPLGQKKTKTDPSLDKDLDIPGSELDDDDELIGKEDEENNYYSIGGENHEDLEEDKG